MFPTKTEAETFLSELRSRAAYNKVGIDRADGAKTLPMVSDLFKLRVSEIKEHRRLIRCKRIFTGFESSLDFDLPIESVKKLHFRQFIRKRELEGVKAETIDREINELSAAFNRAPFLFPALSDDFVAPVVRPKVDRKKKFRRTISADEAIAIAASLRGPAGRSEHPERIAARPVVARMFEVSWYLGLRIGESENLNKADFKLDKRELSVFRSKTKIVTVIPNLPDRVVELLHESIEHSQTGKIFDLPCSRTTLEHMIRDACEANGIAYGRGKIDGVTFHSTRHSFTTRLIRVTDMATAASFTGHSSEEMVDYYSHADDESRQNAMSALYGEGSNAGMKKLDLKTLKRIYNNIRSGKLSLDEFLKQLDVKSAK